jgi:hypothetical protein
VSDVFISYKREDEACVRRLYDALIGAGFSVWWDLDTEGGAAWRQRIEKELDAARCVLVVWSPGSVGEQGTFVRDEATRALHRGVLLPVRIQKVSPPLGFGEYQALDLIGWDGDGKDRRIQDVVAGVRAIVAGRTRPGPTWPSRRRRMIALSAVGATSVMVLLAALLQPALQRAVCAIPGIRRLCSSPENCFKWVDRRRTLPLYMRENEEASSSEAIARAETERKAPDEAQRLCPKGDGILVRSLIASYEVTKWNCTYKLDGHRCSFDGQAICNQQERVRARAGECEP